MSLIKSMRKIRNRRRWSKSLAKLDIAGSAQLHADAISVREGAASEIGIGSESMIEGRLVIERSGAQIRVGDRSFIGGGTVVDSALRIDIGHDVMVSFDVLIFDHDSHSLILGERLDDVRRWRRGEKDWSHVPVEPIRLENGCWIGARAILLKGISVGEGAVVAAGSVVTRDVPAWTVVAGNPARVIRELHAADLRG